MFVLTAEQMKTLESNAVGLGLSWLRLMENAGSAAAKVIRSEFDLKNSKVVIVCGKGNNGGDGYVIARKLNENDIPSKIIAVGMPTTDSSKEMFAKTVDLGLKPLDFNAYEQLACKFIEEADFVIDALFGTGFKGVPKDVYATAIKAINRSKATVISVDTPSGIDSDQGTADGEFVKASMTVTFAAYKPCHLLYPSNEYCGKVTVTPIGIPDAAYKDLAFFAKTVSDEDAAKLLPTRGVNHHKGLSGTLGLYVGSFGMAGAAIIAAKGAVRSGVGIANIILPESIYPIVAMSIPEAVCTVLKGNSGNADPDDETKLCNALSNCCAALVGCGIGRSKFAESNAEAILKTQKIPLVLDADGINILADSIDILRDYNAPKILTPHPKEAARLLNCTVDEILKNRAKSALIIAKFTRSVTVLKGANTVIATPDSKLYFITDGNPAMSTAGTGDMLAGMAAAFLAQGLSADTSAVLSAKLHALSGDRALESSSLLSLTPTDMLKALPKVINELYSLR
ncbi:MAG: NAD(P)H-hydrate dehydratase [Ruminococcaceae bacterium]|nr:NAD(P)H-hydrate dehydratase [Oscillospiraceae bacterium]